MIDEQMLNAPKERGKIVISLVGCDRPSLMTACTLVDAGFKVFCVDPAQLIVDHLKRGILPFNEPTIESKLENNIREGRLTATADVKSSVSESDIVLLLVSPEIDQKKRPDYSNIEKVCRDVGLSLHPGALVIIGTDLPPGITETLVQQTLEASSGLKAGVEFGLAYYSTETAHGRDPEGAINDPKIFGAIDRKSSTLTRAFLSTLTKGDIVEMSSIKAAEAVRLFQSVYREANTALANELASFCEKARIDFAEIREAINLKSQHHLASPDIIDGHTSEGSYLLIEEAENLKIRPRMIMLARKINDDLSNQTFRLVRDALRSCGRSLRRARVLVLGVSCRPDVKELKGSYVKEIIELLTSKGFFVRVHDPLFSYKELTEVGLPAERTFTESIKGMDCLLIAVGHERFRRLNLGRIRLLMKKPPALVDLSNILEPSEVEKKGFVYRGLGRGVWTR